MAAIGKVAAVFTASTSGLQAGVDAAVRSFRAMGGDAGSLKDSLSSLKDSSVAMTLEIANLAQRFQAGAISAGQFYSSFSGLAEQINATARATASAAEITRQNITAEQQYFQALDRISDAVKNGGLQEAVAARARREAFATYLESAAAADSAAEAASNLSGVVAGAAAVNIKNPFAGLADEFATEISAIGAAAAETDWIGEMFSDEAFALSLVNARAADAVAGMESLSAAHARGAQVARANMTAEEQHAEKLADLDSLLRVGAISSETYSRATAAMAAEMQKTSSATKQAETGLSGVVSRLNALIALDVAKIVGSVASAFAGWVSWMGRVGMAEADVVSQTGQLADRLGMTYGELSGLAYAGELAGISLDQIGNAVTRADVAFVRAANGSQQAAAALDSVGVSVEQLNGLSAAERFDAIASAIAELPTEAERAAAAVRIFGQSGADLLPLFNSGAEGIANARAESERLGLNLNNAQSNNVRAMSDSFVKVREAISGVVQQVVAYLAPAVTAISSQFVNLVGTIGGANIGQAIGAALLSGAEFLAGVGDMLIANFSGVFQYLSGVGGQWNAVFGYANMVGKLFLSAFKTFEFVGNTIGGAISDIVSMLLGAAADTAALIPGFGNTAAGLRETADYMAGQADTYLESANANLTAAGQAFSDAFASEAPAAGQAIAGPLVTSLRAAQAAAESAASQIDTATRRPVEIKQEVVVDVKEAIKGIDSRSKEGVAEMFRIIRGDTGNVAEKTLATLEVIADNTADLEPSVALALPGA